MPKCFAIMGRNNATEAAYMQKLLKQVKEERTTKKRAPKRNTDPSKPVWLTELQKVALDSFGFLPERILQVRHMVVTLH